MIRLSAELRKGIGPLFTCSLHGDYIRITTPFLLPDRDCIDLFCKVDGDAITVTDLADTTGWLRMQSGSPRRSSRQNLIIKDVCMTHEVEFHRGMLQSRCRSGEELADTVMRVAQAAVRVSDLVYTLRTPSIANTERISTAQNTAGDGTVDCPPDRHGPAEAGGA